MKAHDETDAERIIRVEGDIASLKGSVSGIERSLGLMNEKLSGIGRPNWMLLIGLMTVLISLGGMAAGTILYVTKSEITNQVTPVALQAASSQTDRRAHAERIDSVTHAVSEIEVRQSNQEAALKEQLREIETQFRAISQIQNVRTAYNQQILGLLWGKTYHEPLPQVNYFSDMSQPKAHGN